jgi:hypothetical protein
MALIEITRNVFRKELDTRAVSRLPTLEALVSTASAFAVTDPRDIVYALLYLANDRDDAIVSQISAITQHAFSATYTEHPVDIFTAFVRYCLERSGCLDIMCRPWAMWPTSEHDIPYVERILPTWIGVAMFAKDTPQQQIVPIDGLVGAYQHRVYDASKGMTIHAEVSKSVLQADGKLVNLVHVVSAQVREGLVENHCLRMLGWSGSLENDVDEKLWRTLVANRSLSADTAPASYRRAAALALTMLDGRGDLDIASLIADDTLPSTVVEYLARAQKATDNRRVFRSVRSSLDWAGMMGGVADAIVGLGPHGVQRYDMVCILFGCSVPVILRSSPSKSASTMNNVVIIEPCYVDGFMEG